LSVGFTFDQLASICADFCDENVGRTVVNKLSAYTSAKGQVLTKSTERIGLMSILSIL